MTTMTTITTIPRTAYINRLASHRDKDYIKILVGVRRCGKSTIFEQYKSYLMSQGVKPEQILSYNFDEIENEPLTDYRALYQAVLKRVTSKKKHYIFLDEVQEVEDFHKALVSLFNHKNIDLYVTGSNSKLLSGEIATLISGRYVQIEAFPLSFSEYYGYFGGNAKDVFTQYLTCGGFPYASMIEADEVRTSYLQGILNTVLVKDVLSRKKQASSLVVESIVKFLFSNNGNHMTVKKIADTLTSMSRKTTSPTVESYLSALEDAFVVYRVENYDVYGRRFLELNNKIFVADIGLKNALLGKLRSDIGHDLENLVYLELLRRGFTVYVGKIDGKEIDLVAIKGDERLYLQVCASVLDEHTFEREIAPLRLVRDNYPKLILTLDDIPTGSNGINQVNLIDWLLDETP